jgi:hypothetical protein
MSRKQNNNNIVGLVNGTMAVAKKAAKVRNLIRKRHFLTSKSVYADSEQVLSTTQSPYPTGTQFLAGTLLFEANDLSANAISWIQSHDRYRISQVEVFATISHLSREDDQSVPVELYFYEDTDADVGTQTSWLRVQDRDNVGRVVLTQAQPSMRLITFKPTISFAAGSAAQATANAIPDKNAWLDALSINQIYSGLRYFSCTPTRNTSGSTFQYTLALTRRYTIEACQPI